MATEATDNDDGMEMDSHAGLEGVIRVRYLQVFRSSKSLLKFPMIFSLLSIGRQSRHSDGFVLMTFLFSKPGLRCTHARVWEPSRILFLLDNLGLVFALDKGRGSHNLGSKCCTVSCSISVVYRPNGTAAMPAFLFGFCLCA